MTTADWEMITPPQARIWLDAAEGRNKRKLDVHHRDFLAGQMTAGEWREDAADPVRFNGDGLLVDGQHRISAILKSGVSLRMLVVRGLSSEAVEVIDCGKVRNLSVRTGTPKKEAALYQAIRRYFHPSGRQRNAWNSKMSVGMLREYQETYGVSAAFVLGLPDTAKRPNNSPFHAAIALAHHGGAEPFFLETFVSTVRTGRIYGDPVRDETALKLTRYFDQRTGRQRGALCYMDWAKTTQYVLDKYIRRRQCKQLRVGQGVIWCDGLQQDN
jgi:hypothetical protein